MVANQAERIKTLENGQEQLRVMLREHMRTTTSTTMTTSTSTTTTTTTTAIWLPDTVMQAVAKWIQADFPQFKSTSVKFKRCYSMARDKRGSKGFHDGCNGKGPTVTVVKTKEGHVFGGAADESWTSGSVHPTGCGGVTVPTQHAFLFCVDCAGTEKGAAPSQIKLKLKPTGNGGSQKALVHFCSYGPFFGNDLTIDGPRSSAHLGNSYACPVESDQIGSTACKRYLAGSEQFTVVDYEVFTIQA